MLVPDRAPAPDQLKPLVAMKKHAGLFFYTPEHTRSATDKN